MKRNESGAPRAPLRMQIAWRSITRVFVYAIPGPCPRLLAAPATIVRRADKSQFIVREPGITRAFMHVPLFHHRFANCFASGPIRCASDPRFCFKSTQKSTENIDIDKRTILRNSLIILSYLYSDSHNVRKDSLAAISRRRDPASSRFFAISDFSSRCCQQKNPVLTLIHVQPVLQHFGPDDVSNDVLWKVRETTRYQEFHRSSHLKWFTQKKKKEKKTSDYAYVYVVTCAQCHSLRVYV